MTRQRVEGVIRDQRDAIKAAGNPIHPELLEKAWKSFVQVQGLDALLEGEELSDDASRRLNARFDRSMQAQQDKQRIMRRLEDDLATLRAHPEAAVTTDPHGRNVIVRDGALCVTHNESETRLSAGDTIADLWWGINYNLPGDAPLSLKKRYLYERTAKELWHLDAAQMAAAGFGASSFGVEWKKERSSGLLAERIALSFLIRAGWNTGLFRAYPGDPIADTVEKSDIIIERRLPKGLAGVTDETGNPVAKIGVQLTVSESPRTPFQKRMEIDEARPEIEKSLDDVVIAQLPGDWSRPYISMWEREGMPSGGPERYLTDGQKIALLAPILQALFTPEDIEKHFSRPQG